MTSYPATPPGIDAERSIVPDSFRGVDYKTFFITESGCLRYRKPNEKNQLPKNKKKKKKSQYQIMNTLTCRSKCNILRYWIYLTIMNKEKKHTHYNISIFM